MIAILWASLALSFDRALLSKAGGRAQGPLPRFYVLLLLKGLTKIRPGSDYLFTWGGAGARGGVKTVGTQGMDNSLVWVRAGGCK